MRTVNAKLIGSQSISVSSASCCVLRNSSKVRSRQSVEFLSSGHCEPSGYMVYGCVMVASDSKCGRQREATAGVVRLSDWADQGA